MLTPTLPHHSLRHGTGAVACPPWELLAARPTLSQVSAISPSLSSHLGERSFAPQEKPEQEAGLHLSEVEAERLVSESLAELWETCLRPKTAVAAVIDCWSQLVHLN